MSEIADAFSRAEQLIFGKLQEIKKLKQALAQIWCICHIPTSPGMRAYTHFQRDFDEIRAICKSHTDDLDRLEAKLIRANSVPEQDKDK